MDLKYWYGKSQFNDCFFSMNFPYDCGEWRFIADALCTCLCAVLFCLLSYAIYAVSIDSEANNPSITNPFSTLHSFTCTYSISPYFTNRHYMQFGYANGNYLKQQQKCAVRVYMEHTTDWYEIFINVLSVVHFQFGQRPGRFSATHTANFLKIRQAKSAEKNCQLNCGYKLKLSGDLQLTQVQNCQVFWHLRVFPSLFFCRVSDDMDLKQLSNTYNYV